jgi:hypothetical protein
MKHFVISTIAVIIVALALWSLAFVTPLRKHGYQLSFDWNQPRPPIASTFQTSCDRTLSTSGFPLTEQRPNLEVVGGCLNDSNPLAGWVNKALYLAIAVLVVIALAGVFA